jgi:membrane-bound lytic murein transglycosylase D
MRNAINSLGTSDFFTIVTRYEGRYFGFASRNFYAEFLAACKVMNQADKYFKKIDYAKAQVHDSITISRPLYVSALIDNSSLTREELRTLNPALQSSVIFSKRPIPAGYQLRLPVGRYKDLNSFIAQVRGAEPKQVVPNVVEAKTTATTNKVAMKSTAPGSKCSQSYVVRKGDTLFSISRKFSSSIAEIQNANGMNHSRIMPGQKLRIPIC